MKRAIRHARNFKHSLDNITDEDKYGRSSIFRVRVYLNNNTVMVDCNTTITSEPYRIRALLSFSFPISIFFFTTTKITNDVPL